MERLRIFRSIFTIIYKKKIIVKNVSVIFASIVNSLITQDLNF